MHSTAQQAQAVEVVMAKFLEEVFWAKNLFEVKMAAGAARDELIGATDEPPVSLD